MREFFHSSLTTAKKRQATELNEHRLESGWEHLVISVAAGESLPAARARLVEHAELGHWELQRTVIFYGGRRKYWLRRRAINVVRS